METNTVEKELDFDEVYSGINNYIKYAAKSVAITANMSSYLSVEDLYAEGSVLLVQCFDKYKNLSKQEFGAVFKASLWRHLRKLVKKPTPVTVDIDEAYDLGYTDDTIESMFMEYGMSQLKDMLKSDAIAEAILNELIEPSPRTIWEMKMDTARKNMLKAQGKKINIPQNNKVKMVHIKRALGITQKQFDLGIQKVRNMAVLAFGNGMELEY